MSVQLKEPINSTLILRNVLINKHRTSMRLEPIAWMLLEEIATRENTNVHKICELAQEEKAKGTSLTSAVRIFIMRYFYYASENNGQKAQKAKKGAHRDRAMMWQTLNTAASELDALLWPNGEFSGTSYLRKPSGQY